MMTHNSLKSQKGASSVLVIFMMLVLITFGALAITSANVNYKLSRRTLEWNNMYYDLDGQGERFICALDAKLAYAESKAAEYIKSEGYAVREFPDIAPQIQETIFAEYSGNNLTNEEVFNKIYMYYADIFVKELLLDFNGLEVYPLDNEGIIESIYAFADFKPGIPGYEICGLKVSVFIEPQEYAVSGTGNNASITRESGIRYKIEDWYEYQSPLGEEEPVELWDGVIELE